MRIPADQLNRAELLKKARTTVLGAAALAAGAPAGAADEPLAPKWKGKPGSKVRRWDVITIGNLSRNRYWGEGDEKGLRSVICTCTLIQGEGFRLLVDASLAEATQ